MSRIMVTGGAGYIGSHTVQLLQERGVEVHVADNLSTGHRESLEGVPLHVIDLRDGAATRELFARVRPTAVIHFAAHCYVGESVVNPRKYFEDNLGVTLNVLGAMLDADCRRFVFSSTCAVYGVPREVPIPEDHPRDPVNPYGETKYVIERVLRRYDAAYGLKYAVLRYFNAAGADPSGRLGESHDPETHLIPLMARAILDPDFTLSVYGTDYPTPDGTCVRDYIHVTDLGRAHLLALDRLEETGESGTFNLGTGEGFSVMDMIRRLERIAGRPVKHRLDERRAGDPPRLVAAADKARRDLGWSADLSDVDTILETAWNWHGHPRF